MSDFVKRGSTSVTGVIRLSKESDGSAFTGLDHTSAGLFLTARADNEAAGITYKQADTNLEAGTVGSYTTPTAGKCRFTEVSAVNEPGSYQYDLVDERYGVVDSNSLYITVGGVADLKVEAIRVHLGIMDSSDFPTNFSTLDISASGFVGSNLKQILGDGTIMDAFQKAIDAIIAGSAIAGTLTPTQMSTDLSQAADDTYKDNVVIWKAGPLLNVKKQVTGSTGTSNVVLTFVEAPVAPQDGNAFILT